MIKKGILINTLILLMIPFIITNVYGLEEITVDHYYEVGRGNDEMLYNNGYSYSEGTVKWDKEGCYETIHLDQNNQRIKVKNHIIPQIIKDRIETSYENITSIEILDNYIYCETYFISEHNYYVVCNYQEVDYTYYDQERVAILYYENDTLKWYYHYNKYSHFVNGYLKDDNLIVSFNIYNENEEFKTSCCVLEITPNRVISKEKEFKGNERVELNNLFLYKDYIYLVINTKSNTLDFKDLNINNSVVFKLEYRDFSIIDQIALNYNVSMYVKKAYNCLNQLYLFTKSNDNNSLYLVIINLDNGYMDSIHLNNNINEINTIFKVNNKLYLVVKKQNKTIIIDKTDQEIYQFDQTIDNVIILKCNDNRCYLGVIKDQKLIKLISFQNEITKEYSLKIDVNNVYNISFLDDYFLIITKENHILKAYKFSFFEFIYQSFTNSEDKKLVINGEEIEPIDCTYNTDLNTFGTYLNYKTYSYKEKLKVNFVTKTIVPINVNVKHHCTYSLGYVLKFNGKGILGNKEISSGYKCNDIGNYSLEITGANDEKKIITFTISNLVVEPIEKAKCDVGIKNIDFYNQNIKGEVNNVIEIQDHNNTSFNITLFLIIVVIGITGLIIIERKIKK